MKTLSLQDKTEIIQLLCEGMGIRSVCRIKIVARNTILKLIKELGTAADFYSHLVIKDLSCARIQCDEITSIIGGRKKNLDLIGLAKGWGEKYTWVAIEPDSKFIINWHTGKRNREDANIFLESTKARISIKGGLLHIASDAYAAYKPGIADLFGLEARHETFLKNDLRYFKGKKSTPHLLKE